MSFKLRAFQQLDTSFTMEIVLHIPHKVALSLAHCDQLAYEIASQINTMLAQH